MQHQQPQSAAMNCSYDDLPPPPPPLSSSPSPPGGQGEASDSDNNSSVVTAAMPPVPQLRSSIRRNEYVNIPVTQKVTEYSQRFNLNESEHKTMTSQQFNSWYSIWIMKYKT